MTAPLLFALTFITAIGSGLAAGVFFAFSTFVMAGLARLPPAQGIAAMQSINVTAISPLFMVLLFGTGLLCLVLIVLSLTRWSAPGSAWLLIGGVLYVAGALLITMAFNVPLNDALATADPTSTEGAALWARYLSEWTAWNHVRTIVPTLASVALVMALLRSA